MIETQTTNRLINETSPYLLQHAHNPVDWYPWGEEAFQKAREEDKPILLSCGYSACHWCHVMERESFESPAIADLMNRYFINIKVDREERPDIDQLYQEAVRILTGQGGGWPLTVFMDTEGYPFYGGTYFPPRPMYGRSSFPQVLEAVHQKWVGERELIRQASVEIGRYLRGEEAQNEAMPMQGLPVGLAAQASSNLLHHFDREHGGFGGAPKFPTPTVLQLVAVSGVLNQQPDGIKAFLFTLEQMARGGIYDQLGGGFHRYATDRIWLVPHFEKMLYDNGQLLKLYAIGYQLQQSVEFQTVTLETADYLRREMQSPEGGFYATQDADSEGVEGKFFLWTYAEIDAELTPEEARLFKEYYGIKPEGNFEGATILNRLELGEVETGLMEADLALLEEAQHKLFAVREKRVKPFLDQKIITGWNGLTISGLAYVYQVFGREGDYQAARQAADFVLTRLRLEDGSLARIFMDGQAKVGAMLDDYVFLAQSLLDLYEADFDPAWLERTAELTHQARERFGSSEGIYYLAPGGPLVARPISRYDQATPSGVSVQLGNLLRLTALTGKPEWREEAERILSAYGKGLAEQAWGCAGLIAQYALYQQGLREFVFVSDTPEPPEILQKLRQVYIPDRIMAWARPGQEDLSRHPARELFEGRSLVNGEPTCYLCANQQCLPPMTQWNELKGHLESSLRALNE